MKFFQTNLQSKGRWIRAVSGLLLLAAAALVWSSSTIAGLILLGSAGFVLFEAARGWCLLRACGIRTKF